ncbi:hypothetical protein PQQ75_04210 [Paraburkholderia aspalathi]|uniref:hypothetical protein n=1 Tax=Paraburkholderia aspalathi TaxID=1324617 RepID=UPI0038B8CE2C
MADTATVEDVSEPVTPVEETVHTVDTIKAAARAGQVAEGTVTLVHPMMEVVTTYDLGAQSGKGISLGNGWMVDDLATGTPYRAGSDRGTYRFTVNTVPVDEATLARMLERGQPAA